MIPELLETLNEDCHVLLSRALIDKTVNAFGIDGMGQYGTCDVAKQFKIIDLNVVIDPDSDLADIRGLCQIKLDTYDIDQDGLIFTDKNLQISLNSLLVDADIAKTCWIWADEVCQGADFFTIKLDVNKLIQW